MLLQETGHRGGIETIGATVACCYDRRLDTGMGSKPIEQPELTGHCDGIEIIGATVIYCCYGGLDTGVGSKPLVPQ